MLTPTLVLQLCEICRKKADYPALPICKECLQKLPEAKKIGKRTYLAFLEEANLSPELLAGIAASRFIAMGGCAEAVLQTNNRLAIMVAWYLDLPLSENCHRHILAVKPIFENKRELSELSYLYLKIKDNTEIMHKS